ncbi:MAG: alpha/beta fold hydrolase [Kofleriaceae bacterium]
MDWTFEHAMIVRRFGSGAPMVWIHGLGEWSASFDACAPLIDGFTHVLPDLPGSGRSPWPAAPRSLDESADDLASWLREQPPAILVGHSQGGVLATLIAERIAVRGIVNIDGNLTRGDCSFSLRALAYEPAAFVEHGFAKLLAEVYELGLTDPALRGYFAALRTTSPAVFHRHARELVALSETETLAPRLAALTVPVLVLAGVPRGICEHSRRELDRLGVRWRGVEPAGHWLFVDQPAAFAAAVASFAHGIG